MATSRAGLFRLVAGALFELGRKCALELFVFDLIAGLQGWIVALEQRAMAIASPGSSCLAIAEMAFSAAMSMDSPAGRAATAAIKVAVVSSCQANTTSSLDAK